MPLSHSETFTGASSPMGLCPSSLLIYKYLHDHLSLSFQLYFLTISSPSTVSSLATPTSYHSRNKPDLIRPRSSAWKTLSLPFFWQAPTQLFVCNSEATFSTVTSWLFQEFPFPWGLSSLFTLHIIASKILFPRLAPPIDRELLKIEILDPSLCNLGAGCLLVLNPVMESTCAVCVHREPSWVPNSIALEDLWFFLQQCRLCGSGEGDSQDTPTMHNWNLLIWHPPMKFLPRPCYNQGLFSLPLLQRVPIVLALFSSSFMYAYMNVAN